MPGPQLKRETRLRRLTLQNIHKWYPGPLSSETRPYKSPVAVGVVAAVCAHGVAHGECRMAILG